MWWTASTIEGVKVEEMQALRGCGQVVSSSHFPMGKELRTELFPLGEFLKFYLETVFNILCFCSSNHRFTVIFTNELMYDTTLQIYHTATEITVQ